MFKFNLLKVLALTSSCIIIYMFTTVVIAGTFQSHESIYQVANKFISTQVAAQQGQQPEIKTGKLDSRLKLNKCDKALRAFLSKGSRTLGRTTVGVKCTGSKPWSLLVPVTISIYKNVLVAARTLQKGDILTEVDIKLAKHDLAGLAYGYFETKSTGIGLKVKKRALAGDVLTPAMLKKPQVIKRGQKISILAQTGSVEVRMMGEALNNGAIGDRIKVINLKSRQKLDAFVVTSAEVKVDI